MTLLFGEALPLLAVLVSVVALAACFVRSASVAMWVLVAIVVATQAVVPAYVLQVTIAGFNFNALDVVAVLMLAIGVIRLFSRQIDPAIELPIALLVALLAIHVALGAADFGLERAANGSRPWLYFTAPLVFASQARWSRRSLLPLLAGAAVLAAFALVRLAQNGLYQANEFIDVGGELVDARPVTAAGALLIVHGIVISLSGRFVRSPAGWLGIAAMGATVVLLQHRTVWVIVALIAVIGYVRWARAAIFVNERAALGAASAVLLLSPILVALVASSSVFAESARSATARESTFTWRTESWRQLTEEHDSAQDLLVGIPAGTSLERRVGSQVATQSVHSLYVDAFLNLGLLGPVLMVWFWAVIAVRRQFVGSLLGLSSGVVILLAGSMALFGITNMLGPLQGLLVGAMLLAAHRKSLASFADTPLAPGSGDD